MSNITQIQIGSNIYDIHDETAVSKAGDTMTGKLILSSSGMEMSSEAGYVTDEYGNFKHKRDAANDNFNIKANDGTVKFALKYESGAITNGTWNGSAIGIAYGGTGATTRLGAAQNLTSEDVGASATYFVTLTNNWGKFGYSSAANAWTALGGGSIGKKNSLAASDIPNLSTDKLTSGTLPIARGGTGNTTGNAATATKLATARGLGVQLDNAYKNGQSSYPSFDGSGNVLNIGVSGQLGTGNGGTGGTDSGWNSLTNSSTFTGTIHYRRIGKWVEVRAFQIKLKANLTDNNGITLAALPSGYRPSDYSLGVGAGNAIPGMGLLTVDTSGNMKLFKDSSVTSYSTSTNIYFGFMFMIA